MDVRHILTCKLNTFTLMDKDIRDIIDHDPRLRLRVLIRERLAEHRSILSIAREFHCSPNTVRSYAAGSSPPGARKTAVRTPTALTPAVRERIAALLEAQSHAPGRRRLTAVRIHELLSEEGLELSYSSVQQEVRRQRAALLARGFVQLAYDPGEKMQLDFGEERLAVGGRIVTVHYLVCMLCHSQYTWARAYTAQTQECLLDGLIGMFRHCGGVPRTIIFDNARTAVASGSGARSVMQRRYAALCSHYGCEGVFCNARQGHEKGLVEGQVGYLRRHALTGREQGFASLEAVQQALDQACAERNARTLRGRERSIAEDFERERVRLLSLPQADMEVGECRCVRVSGFSRVRFEGNEYSVPAGLEGRELTLRTLPGLVRLCLGGTCVAVHYRLRGRGRISECLAHQLPKLLQRPRAVCDAAVVRAVVPAHERARLLTMGGDVRAVAACLHQHARRQLQHELPPQEGQPLPELAELLRGLRPADKVHNEPNTDRDLSAYDALVTLEAH